jgi:hypothetical protein
VREDTEFTSYLTGITMRRIIMNEHEETMMRNAYHDGLFNYNDILAAAMICLNIVLY